MAKDDLQINSEIENNLKNLKDFLLDIDCLDQLSKWTSQFNMFDILKISRTEIRHSNMLAWLLDPKANHGLGDEVIRRFIQHAVMSISDNSDIDNSDIIFNVLLKDCGNFIIQREYQNIDILAVSKETKTVLCIENKVGSGEHDDQLVRYRKIIEKQYADFDRIYIFLSPYGNKPSDDKWCSMNYQKVLDIIEHSKQKVKLIPEAELMIENYMETIRRHVVGDNELVRICTEIYSKYHDAIDLIIENKEDKDAGIAEIFRNWAQEKTDQGEIIVDIDKSEKRLTRFKTKRMSDYLPDTAEASSGWKTKNHYFYEIYNNNGESFFIQFALSAKGMSSELLEKSKVINSHYPSKQQKDEWQWKVCKKTTVKEIDEDYTEETIKNQLDELLIEINDFENELFEKIEKQYI